MTPRRPAPHPASQRRFLFLQGPRSPFFARLGAALRRDGHHVHKINFSAGDSAYWRLLGGGNAATAFRGPMARLPAFYAEHCTRLSISDLVLFGDCRPVHRPAIEYARVQGRIRVHVFEEGYFRPHWITLEQGGVNGHSALPRDPAWYLEAARTLAPAPRPQHFASPLWQRAAHDIAYNLCATADPCLHRRIQGHVPYSIVCEYLAYLRRAIWVGWRRREARVVQTRLLAERERHPFYLLPLQLDSDAQIVHHSPFASMTQAMQHALASFARAAPAHTRLAVKRHPLDPGLIHYRQQLTRTAHQLGIGHRVFFLESGLLDPLLKASRGLITVNSTVGASALAHRCPVIALGTALYALPGLTFQGALDDFWTKANKPDAGLVRAFRQVVITRTQINGGLHSAVGIQLAVQNAVARLTAAESTREAILTGDGA